MENRPDNLQEAEGRKDNEENNTPIDVSANESSMVQESEHSDPEMHVSTDEDIESGEPDYAEPQSDKKVAETPENKESEGLDEDAMLSESEKEVTKTMVSDEDISDEDLEKEDDTEEVHSDEDHHDEHASHHLEMPDYGEYTPEKLITEAEQLLKNEEINMIKDHFDAIRRNLLKQLNEERQHKLEEFIEGGGNEIDFEYIQPLREKFRKLFGEYRNQRQKFYKDLQDKLENNLKIKLDLIEQLKEIVNKEESIGDTFKEFNQIQQEWRNTGPVPRGDSSDLYRTYHHHVENFYEYIKINKELRDLDFKKNREIKENLIKEAETLLEKDNVPEAFRELQNLHRKWKNTGPVERENREPMWEKFSEITRQVHDRREGYYGQLKEKAEDLIKKKQELIDQLQLVPFHEINAHHRWQEAIKKVESIREQFRKIGRINHPDNDEIWDKFRAVLRDFNRTKNQFYKDLKKQHQDNLLKKKELLAIAEQLKDSDDWRETTNEMKRIQSEWKKIGHVPKSESDKIWKQFRNACNHFFDRLTEHNKDREKAFEGNYTAKEALLKKLSDYETKDKDQKENVKALKDVIQEWKDIGRVPRDKNKIEGEFNRILDQKFKSIDLDRKEAQRIRFENKMESLSDQGGLRQLQRERDHVKKQINDATKELGQLETNLSFFSSSNPKNPLIKEAENNINKHREQIELLQEKLKMLTVKMRAMRKEDEQAEASQDDSASEDAGDKNNQGEE